MIDRGNSIAFAIPASMAASAADPRCLVCIPCFNSEDTIVEVVAALLRNSAADILLVDDLSDKPLEGIIRKAFPSEDRVTVLRPKEKVFTGGAKNMGLQRGMDEDYDFAIMMDSDVVVGPNTVRGMQEFLRTHPDEVVVSAAILPFGNLSQYADTLINFSNYLPNPARDVSRKECLAGYAFAINLVRFRASPCLMPRRIGGDDVLFFRGMQARLGIDTFALLNHATVVHKPPRATLQRAVSAQRRYGMSFFSHNQNRRNAVFNRWPMLHLLTPRFLLMLARLVRCRRFRDLLYAPVCWYLDLRRAVGIIQLQVTGFQDPLHARQPVSRPQH